MDHIILCLDLDSFYASVEEQRHPEIAGRPVVICVYSGRTATSGAVATANYAARKLGIGAGMPIAQAMRLGDAQTVFLPYERPYYESVSDRIMELIEDQCDVLEQASIDEAYLDVTQTAQGDWQSARAIAQAIQHAIRQHESLTCSIGIGPNKLIAKMASKQQKPQGLTVIREDAVPSFLAPFPVEKLHGIGPRTATLLHTLGITTAAELAAADMALLEGQLGKNKAQLLQDKARGIDPTPVLPREKQQLSKIGTLKEDSRDEEVLVQKLAELFADLKVKIEKNNTPFRTVALICIDSRLGMQTRSETIVPTADPVAALQVAKRLLAAFLAEHADVTLRRIGLRVSNFTARKEQKTLGEFSGDRG